MNRRTALVTAGVGVLALALAPARAAEWVKLYNGKDLTGWHVIRGKIDLWKANGELLTCTGRGGGCLATDKQYGDFELKLDFRIPPGGNTGVGIRFPPDGWPSTDGMEIQILDDDHPRYATLKAEHRNGSIYTHAAPKAKAHKPAGEWNQYVIRCQGPRVTIHLNGTEIHNVNLDDFSDSLGKGKVPLGKRERRGSIGFPSHGDPIDFRNIEIKEL